MSLIPNEAPFAPKKAPLTRPDHKSVVVAALRALAGGSANEAQQKMALDYIINQVCGTYDMAYRPSSDRDTVFALGKQHVGQTIVWLLNAAPTKANPDKVSTRSVGEKPDVDS